MCRARISELSDLLDNLKTIRKSGWHWLTRLKKNRLVNPDSVKNMQIQEIEIPPEGRDVHLKAYGFIKVFRIVSKDGDIGYWATDVLEMDEANAKKWQDIPGRLKNITEALSNSAELKTATQEKVSPREHT
jgi:hypothetical protein